MCLSYPILSYPILSYPILSYPILSYPILSYAILCYPMLCYPILSYPILSYPILSYPILSYPILSYLILSYRILCLNFRPCNHRPAPIPSYTQSVWQNFPIDFLKLFENLILGGGGGEGRRQAKFTVFTASAKASKSDRLSCRRGLIASKMADTTISLVLSITFSLYLWTERQTKEVKRWIFNFFCSRKSFWVNIETEVY